VDGDEGGSSVKQVKGISVLDVLRRDLLWQVERSADLIHFLLVSKRPETLELGVVKGETGREDLWEEVERGKGAVVVVDVILI
jgi:hypothetical protein